MVQSLRVGPTSGNVTRRVVVKRVLLTGTGTGTFFVVGRFSLVIRGKFESIQCKIWCVDRIHTSYLSFLATSCVTCWSGGDCSTTELSLKSDAGGVEGEEDRSRLDEQISGTTYTIRLVTEL